MTRLIAALVILVACGFAPAGYAQDDCDEAALAAGECGSEASDGDAVDEPDVSGADADAEDSGDQELADDEAQPEDENVEPVADDENVEPMADDESGDEVAAEDDSADLSDAAESDEAADEDTAVAGAEEEESEDDFDTEIAAATDDDDDASADAASGDDLLSTPPPGAPDAPRPPPSAPSVPATQTPAPPVTQTPAPAPSAGTPTPAAQANCSGGGYRKGPGGRCTSPAPAPPGPVSIYVGNLSWTMAEEDLKNMFGVYGTVSSAQIVRDKANGNRSRGFGFVAMPDRAEAETAISSLNDTEVQGRRIVVNDSQPRSGR